MKAVVFEQYGPPDVLQVRDLDRPTPRDDEVLIRVHSAEVSKADCELRRFRFQVNWFAWPLRVLFGIRNPRRPVLGGYFAGVVEAVGSRVSRFQPGDEVFGAAQLRLGAHAEYLCLPERYTIVPKPRNVSFEAAAASVMGGLNALHFMRRAKIRPGERVLVNGAGGSIGLFAVQLAKTMGAEVTAIDAAHKEALLRQTGADHFIDYATEDFRTGGRRYDVIFSVVVSPAYTACLRVLYPNGRYILANPRIVDMLRSVVTSTFTDKTVIVALAGESREELSSLRHLMEAGTVRSVIDRVFPLEKAAEAHRRVESEQRLGAVVLSP